MGYLPKRILRAFVAGGLVRLLAASFACGGSASTPICDRPASPAPASHPPGKSDAGKAGAVVFENVKIFDGKSAHLSESKSVLVVGNRIEKIGAALSVPGNAMVIDGKGRTLMPGLIDAHWHAMLVRPTPAEALAWDVGYANLVAGAEARDTLMRGFTTVRDVGGPTFGLKLLRTLAHPVVANSS